MAWKYTQFFSPTFTRNSQAQRISCCLLQAVHICVIEKEKERERERERERDNSACVPFW